MLRLFNSLGKKIEVFQPANERRVTVFTCGPSIYQRAHIGNFRTFLYEDILVRYLQYKGYRVERGMNITDIEDKAIREAELRGMTVRELADENLKGFIEEMNLLRIKMPDHLPRASEFVTEAAEMIDRLITQGVAYRYGKNIYFDPLRYPGFGKLFGLDMGKWPARRRRFHKDTYPGVQWNLGDFILWDGCGKGDRACWDAKIGRGRPSWNIQDPSMISKYFCETLSIYCGGIDNLYRHHDYSIAILESLRPYPLARYWLHGHHLHVRGHKMSKSRGNILYTDALVDKGYDAAEIRFFLIYTHYRRKLSYAERTMRAAAERLKEVRAAIRGLQDREVKDPMPARGEQARRLASVFEERMDDDLDVRGAFAGIASILREALHRSLAPGEISAMLATLRDIDGVLMVLF